MQIRKTRVDISYQKYLKVKVHFFMLLPTSTDILWTVRMPEITKLYHQFITLWCFSVCINMAVSTNDPLGSRPDNTPVPSFLVEAPVRILSLQPSSSNESLTMTTNTGALVTTVTSDSRRNSCKLKLYSDVIMCFNFHLCCGNCNSNLCLILLQITAVTDMG